MRICHYFVPRYIVSVRWENIQRLRSAREKVRDIFLIFSSEASNRSRGGGACFRRNSTRKRLAIRREINQRVLRYFIRQIAAFYGDIDNGPSNSAWPSDSPRKIERLMCKIAQRYHGHGTSWKIISLIRSRISNILYTDRRLAILGTIFHTVRRALEVSQCRKVTLRQLIHKSC